MKDILAHVEQLRVQAAECELIRDLATPPQKRELFRRLAEHYKILAAELERAVSIGDYIPPSTISLKETGPHREV